MRPKINEAERYVPGWRESSESLVVEDPVAGELSNGGFALLEGGLADWKYGIRSRGVTINVETNATVIDGRG